MNKKLHIDVIMLLVLLSYFIILVDTSLVFTCSKEISTTFKMNTTTSAWISNAYALTFGSLLLLGGKLGDTFDRKKVFIIGLIIFGLGSTLVGCAINTIILIASRAFQGIGAAIIAPGTLAIIMDNYSGKKRTRVISIYGAMSGIGVSLGLIIGAGITTIASWRWGFLVNVPITIILIILSTKYLTLQKNNQESLDILGSITSCLALLLIINGISGIGSQLISLILGIIILLFFIFHEQRIQQPILPFQIFQSASRTLAYIIRFTYSGAITGFWFFTPLILQSYFNFSPIIVGLSFLPMTTVNFLSAASTDYLINRFGNKKLVILGLIITSIGFFGLTFFKYGSTYWTTIMFPMILIGLGQGLLLSPITNLAIENIPNHLAGVGSSMINVMLQVGGAFGLAILSLVSDPFTTQMFAFHIQAIGITLFSSIALITSLLFRNK